MDRLVMIAVAAMFAASGDARAALAARPAQPVPVTGSAAAGHMLKSARPRAHLRAGAAGVQAAAATVPPARPGTLDAVRDSSDGGELRLRRAVAEQRLGKLRGVIDALAPVAFTPEPAFVGADRAAFLLGHAWLELGDGARFEQLAAAVAGWRRHSAWTAWLAVEHELTAAAADPHRAPGLPGVAVTAAWADLAHLSRSAAPPDPGAEARDLAAMAALDTSTALGRELAGAALLRAATRRLERGEDAMPLLERVPAGSALSSRARHLRGVIELDGADAEHGRRMLESLLARDPNYPAQDEVNMALAGHAMDVGDWPGARSLYERVHRNWLAENDTLRGLLTAGATDRVWRAWQSPASAGDALMLDDGSIVAWTDRLVRTAADLSATPEPDVPAVTVPVPAAPSLWAVPLPGPEAWAEVAASASRLAQARVAVSDARADADAARRVATERTRYLGAGLGAVHHEQAQLDARAARLDSLRQRLGELDAQLAAVRDEATRHVLARVAAILAQTADQLRLVRAMRLYHVDGPTPVRAPAVPDGFPTARELLAGEEALAVAIADAAGNLGTTAPALIRRSYEQAWRPGIIDRAGTLDAAARLAAAWARRLAIAVDSTLAAAAAPDSLRRLDARAAALAHAADSLGAGHEALRAGVARAAIERSLAGLGEQREAIDYGLAASAYALSVAGISGPDGEPRDDGAPRAAGPQAKAGAPAIAAAAVADTTDPARDDPKARHWRGVAVPELRAFLDRHPQSFARGELRCRLADLEMLDARQTFHDRMAVFVKLGGANLALPVLDAAPALAIYRTILREDAGFAHVDAVLFNAGSIMADAADPGALPMFQQLVTAHPGSRYCQEAWVRIGDLAFTDRNYADCIPPYQNAAGGADTTLRAIALYKLGWAEFSLDRFLDAADAFRSILDLYAAGGRVDARVNLADEADAYFVQTIARAGGATAFAGYFDRVGPRPYEIRLLRELAQHFRRYSLYADAIAADRLLIVRHPLDPEALLSAGRMIDSFHRWERPALECSARLEYAPVFVPGSAWYAAQSSDSVRAAGAAFARDAWTTVAQQHHRAGRATGSRADYAEALRLYEVVIAHWPDGDATAGIELDAGEVAVQLAEYSRSLAHYGAAARIGRDSVVTQALWQRVSVTDAWYRSTQTPARAADGAVGGSAAATVSVPRTRRGGAAQTAALTSAGLGADSLALAVIAAADTLLSRRPGHPQAADLMWRQGNLAFAHGWHERAAHDFGRLATERPDDRRAPLAASLRADALFRLARYEDAGAAYQQALAAARRAGDDSLAQRAAQAIPVSYYRVAEAAVAADSSAHANHAALFERVAANWPGFEHADLARYRSGLASLAAGLPRVALRQMQALVADFPHSDLVRDAQLEMATIADSLGDRSQAAQAYAEFANRFPADPQSGGALLRAADRFAQDGKFDRADTLRFGYMQRHPEDVAGSMELLADMARRELAAIDAGHPISSLLPAAAPSAAPARHAGARRGAPARAPASAPPPSRVADYLARAAAHPQLASHELLAQVRYLQGEEAGAALRNAPLRQPLTQTIPVAQKLLDATLQRYRESVDFGDSEWAHASTFRIGQTLLAFGDELLHSERPAGLGAADLAAYDDVIAQQARPFFERGEGVWTDLLRQKQAEAPDDPWIRLAQESLWKRIGGRFENVTEAEVPLVIGAPPADAQKRKPHPEDPDRKDGDGGRR